MTSLEIILEKLSELSVISENLKAVKSVTDSLKNDLEIIKKQQTSQNSKIIALEEQLSRTNEEKRAKNLIIFKIQENEKSGNELIQIVTSIARKADIHINELSVDTAYRLGKQQPGKTRPVLIKFIAPRWKKEFFSKIKNLNQLNINITNDLSPMDRKKSSDLLKTRYEMKKKGIAATIKNMQLHLNNKPLTNEEIEEILAPVISDAAATSSANDISTPTTSNTSNADFFAKTPISKTTRKGPGRPRTLSANSQKETSIEQFFNPTSRSTRSNKPPLEL